LGVLKRYKKYKLSRLAQIILINNNLVQLANLFAGI